MFPTFFLSHILGKHLGHILGKFREHAHCLYIQFQLLSSISMRKMHCNLLVFFITIIFNSILMVVKKVEISIKVN